MSSYLAMSILIGLLALALLGYFAFMWTQEKGRSDEESTDSARQNTGTTAGTDEPGPRR